MSYLVNMKNINKNFRIAKDILVSILGRIGTTSLSMAETDSDKILYASQGIHLRKYEEDFRFVPGMITSTESELLLYISTFCELKGDVIEIGSWLRKSTISLAKGCMLTNNGIVHAIDTFKGNPGKEELSLKPLEADETIFERFFKNLRAMRVEEYVKPYQMSSNEARSLINVPARLIFIDGCHDYEAVKEDILLWKDLLLPNGYLLLHDFREDAPGVIQAVKECILHSEDFDCLLLVDSLLAIQKVWGGVKNGKQSKILDCM